MLLESARLNKSHSFLLKFIENEMIVLLLVLTALKLAC